ncbi:MAG: hypothetical protein COB09_17590 [Thalassobium sp.]|nr:MAG: hypothetical protein COB09_17590 [Thalassobium sp.]
MVKFNEVIVVTSYFNNKDEVCRSILSIHEPVDVLVVDDGSMSALSEEYLDSLRSESRISNLFYMRIDENVGIPASLNKALGWINCSGKYRFYCRLDSGDVFYPEKIEKQWLFLHENHDYVMVGCFANYLVCGDVVDKWEKPISDAEIRKAMFLNSPYIHSACMIRLDALALVGGYDESFLAAQDYKLISRLQVVGKLYNLPVVLMGYDYSPDSISTKKRRLQIRNRIRVQLEIFNFSFVSFYGLFRSFLLMLLSRNFARSLERILKFPR